MKLVVQLKLTPTTEQMTALTSTLAVCNQAANQVSQIAFATRVYRNYPLRRRTYGQLRADGLGAQAAQQVIKKVADAYSALHANLCNGRYGTPGSNRHTKVTGKPIQFRPDAAQPFDQRNLSFALDQQTVSLWTVTGRLRDVPFLGAAETLQLLSTCPRGEADLLHRDGLWLLLVTLEVPQAPPNQIPAGFLGVDLGIVNIATTSDGTIMAGRGRPSHRQ